MTYTLRSTDVPSAAIIASSIYHGRAQRGRAHRSLSGARQRVGLDQHAVPVSGSRSWPPSRLRSVR